MGTGVPFRVQGAVPCPRKEFYSFQYKRTRGKTDKHNRKNRTLAI
jgi:hypothetical protein